MVQSPSAITQLTYDHYMGALNSDHKPVHSLMHIPTKVPHPPSLVTTLENVTSELNSLAKFDMAKGGGHTHPGGHTHGWSNTGRGRLLAFVALYEHNRRDARREGVNMATTRGTAEFTNK